MSKISQHIINLSWEQVHNVEKNFVAELLKDLHFGDHQGGGDTLPKDANIAAVRLTCSSPTRRSVMLSM